MPEWKCPAKDVIANMTYEDKTELWQQRMREVQGAIIVASFFQMFIGFFGESIIFSRILGNPIMEEVVATGPKKN